MVISEDPPSPTGADGSLLSSGGGFDFIGILSGSISPSISPSSGFFLRLKKPTYGEERREREMGGGRTGEEKEEEERERERERGGGGREGRKEHTHAIV